MNREPAAPTESRFVVPEPKTRVICPKPPLLMFVFSFRNIGWFNALVATPNSRNVARSVRWKLFCKLRFRALIPGPLTAFRGQLPNVPAAGNAKAAGLRKLLIDWFAG